MTAYELIKDLGGWEGCRLDFVERRAREGASEDDAVDVIARPVGVYVAIRAGHILQAAPAP
ncbi:MAG: hypothetical protein R6W89_12900 [Candidatus Hydrogenedentota bacterium]